MGEEKRMSRKSITNGQRPVFTPRASSKSRPSISLSSAPPRIEKPTTEDDVWGADFKPDSPPPIPVSSFDDPFGGASITPEEFRNGQLARSLGPKPPRTYTRGTLRSAISISERKTHSLEFLKSTNTSTSTIFQDPQHPITIVLTTPEDERPQPHFPETPTRDGSRARNFSVTSLPIMPSQNPSYNRGTDRTLLMPPTDTQVDARKSRHKQDFNDIRKWLISFMNAKGDQFPRKLRGRVMDIYAIRERDLDPDIVARFNAEDEGVAIDQTDGGGGGEFDHKESLRILGRAMRERIEEATPMRRIPAPPPPVTVQRRKTVNGNSNSNGSSGGSVGGHNILPTPTTATKLRKSSPPRKSKPPLHTIPDDEELPPTWLGPLISTSTSSRDSLFADERFLKRLSSTPELQPARSAKPSSTNKDVEIRSRSASVAPDDDAVRGKKVEQRQKKRGSLLSGLRDVFGGRGR